MTARRDVERYVEEESSRILTSRARFVGWPTWARAAAALSVATLLMAPGVAFVLFADSRAAQSTPNAALTVCVVMALLVYGASLRYALKPEETTRSALRRSGSYPTGAPGYSTWKDDRDGD